MPIEGMPDTTRHLLERLGVLKGAGNGV